IDGNVSVTDDQHGALGTVTSSDASPKTYTYSRTIAAPASGCSSNPNTAKFTTNTTSTTGSANQSVTVCRYLWTIKKLVDKTLVEQIGGSAIFNYTVSVSHDTPGTGDVYFDGCITVTDTFKGALGTACLTDLNPKLFTYARTIPVPQWNCLFYPNTGKFTTQDIGTQSSASQNVEICGPAKTGALTMGYWQNKNGQGIITGGASTGGVCNSGTWLRNYAPYQDLSTTATCAQVAT